MQKILYVFTLLIVALVSNAATLPSTQVVLGSSRQTKQQTVGDIMSQTGYKVFFEGRSFNPQATVDFGQQRLSLAEVLNKLTQEDGLEYTVDGGNIIILRKEEEKKMVVAKAEPTVVILVEEEAPAEIEIPKQVERQVVAAPEKKEPVSLGGEKNNFVVVPVSSLDERQYQPNAAFKFNTIYGAAATPNFAVEFGMGRKWTFDAAAAFNPFKLSKEGINRLWFVQPEVRYWPCQRFEKHFWGLHAIYGQYNIGQLDFLGPSFRDHIYKGSAVGAGISWGYHRPLGKRWALEFSIGAGYVYLDYDKYRCEGCDDYLGRKTKHYFGPTKAAVSLIWMIK